MALDLETLALTRTLRMLCSGEIWDETYLFQDESNNEHTKKRGLAIEEYLVRVEKLVQASEELKKRLLRCQKHLLHVPAIESCEYRCVKTVVQETLPGELDKIQCNMETLPRRESLLYGSNKVNMAFDPETMAVVACLRKNRQHLLKVHQELEKVVKNHAEWVGLDTHWTHCNYMDSIDALTYLFTKRT